MINPGDRATRCLFGDGAGVTLLQPNNSRGINILEVNLCTAGKEWQRFHVKAGGTRLPHSVRTAKEHTDRNGNTRSLNDIYMDGLGVLSFFNDRIPRSVKETLSSKGLSLDEIDLFFFHQASEVALSSLEKSLNIKTERVVRTLGEVGNMVSASIPHAIKQAQEDGRVKNGALLMACGFGVGLSWGTAILKVVE